MDLIRYRIRHRTAYVYGGRIDLCHSHAHLRPREDEGQETLSFRIDLDPVPTFSRERTDYFGNRTHYFAIQQSHEWLEVVATATVEKPAVEAQLPDSGLAWDALAIDPNAKDESGVRLGNYLLPTPAFPSFAPVATFLKPSLAPGREAMGLVQEVMERIFVEFKYVPGATDTGTPLETVMEQRAGVCQDFAHVMIAALRSIGVPARYVSGYLETLPPPGKPRLQGADASHAWVEAWTPATGWVGFDPTNRLLPAARHVKVAHGRDYFDVQPLKGIFLGSGSQTLLVQVDVERM
jgi:transglutaminase-like putative cysteine protease